MNKKEGAIFASGYLIGMLKVLFLLALIAGTIWIVRSQRDMPYQQNSGFIFGTTYNITYQSEEDLQEGIAHELLRVDSALSMFNEQSVISHVNRNEPYEPNAMFTEVVTRALQIADDTEGAFDITVAPLVNAWGFGFKSGVKPTDAAIDSIRRSVGYRKIQLTDGRITKRNPQTMLDCSAIAKGYGCDVVARYLRKQGIKNFMVEIGGEVVTCGISPHRVPWKIGVVKPTDDTLNVQQELQTVLNVTDKAMATSGNYRNFYYKGGKKYAHTIDPATGRPVQHSLLSATVLADDCATADAYATSFMVMGMERARKVLERHPKLMAYFIYSDAQGQTAVWYSPSLRDKIDEHGVPQSE